MSGETLKRICASAEHIKNKNKTAIKFFKQNQL